MDDPQLLVQTALDQLQSGHSINSTLCNQLSARRHSNHQSISICIRLIAKKRTRSEEATLVNLSSELSAIEQRLLSAWSDALTFNGTETNHNTFVCEIEVIQRIARKQLIGKELVNQLIRRFHARESSKAEMAAVLSAIAVQGLSHSDQHLLTQAIVATGTIIDLRDFVRQSGRWLIRRYPTGGVSEKVALILPAVLSRLARVYPVAGTFLVGRTMSFTGGTWDKLSVIPGFQFPHSAADICAIIKSTNVAMCTTSDLVAPADRDLYTLRSETGSVASVPLICSSIASKHLAMPAHNILFDVRYGPATFAKTLKGARTIVTGLLEEFRATDISVSAVMQSSHKLSGSSIGNVVELAEALTAMGAANTCRFDSRGIEIQRRLVADQASTLVRQSISVSPIRKQVLELLSSGKLLTDFTKLAVHHHADASVLDSMCRDPASLVADLHAIDCKAKQTGRLVSVDMKAIGTFVNFACQNVEGSRPGQNRSGVVLYKRPKDNVHKDDTLATCYVAADSYNQARAVLQDVEHDWFQIN